MGATGIYFYLYTYFSSLQINRLRHVISFLYRSEFNIICNNIQINAIIFIYLVRIASSHAIKLYLCTQQRFVFTCTFETNLAPLLLHTFSPTVFTMEGLILFRVICK